MRFGFEKGIIVLFVILILISVFVPGNVSDITGNVVSENDLVQFQYGYVLKQAGSGNLKGDKLVLCREPDGNSYVDDEGCQTSRFFDEIKDPQEIGFSLDYQSPGTANFYICTHDETGVVFNSLNDNCDQKGRVISAPYVIKDPEKFLQSQQVRQTAQVITPPVTSPQTESCIDTDGGKNPYVAGRAYYKSTNAYTQDSCEPIGYAPDGRATYGVYEAFCDSGGGFDKELFKCPVGCADGACIQTSRTQQQAISLSDDGCFDEDKDDVFTLGATCGNSDQRNEECKGGAGYDSCTTEERNGRIVDQVIEQICVNGKKSSITKDCPGTCEGGACKKMDVTHLDRITCFGKQYKEAEVYAELKLLECRNAEPNEVVEYECAVDGRPRVFSIRCPPAPAQNRPAYQPSHQQDMQSSQVTAQEDTNPERRLCRQTSGTYVAGAQFAVYGAGIGRQVGELGPILGYTACQCLDNSIWDRQMQFGCVKIGQALIGVGATPQAQQRGSVAGRADSPFGATHTEPIERVPQQRWTSNSCKDSDGDNSYTSGVVVGFKDDKKYSYADTCISDTQVLEYVCNRNTHLTIKIECEKEEYCDHNWGVCKKKPSQQRRPAIDEQPIQLPQEMGEPDQAQMRPTQEPREQDYVQLRPGPQEPEQTLTRPGQERPIPQQAPPIPPAQSEPPLRPEDRCIDSDAGLNYEVVGSVDVALSRDGSVRRTYVDECQFANQPSKEYLTEYFCTKNEKIVWDLELKWCGDVFKGGQCKQTSEGAKCVPPTLRNEQPPQPKDQDVRETREQAVQEITGQAERVFKAVCSDSDGDISPEEQIYTLGYTEGRDSRGKMFSVNDICAGPDTLIEYACNKDNVLVYYTTYCTCDKDNHVCVRDEELGFLQRLRIRMLNILR